jgi:hydroxymethylglutaryl-CoA lyase
MLEEVMSAIPVEKLAVHFHDTYGQSLSNIIVSLQVTRHLKH